MEILALGGSITAGGYFLEFARSLRERNNLSVVVHNHGHGATEITCQLNIFSISIFNNINVQYILLKIVLTFICHYHS